MLQVSFSGLGCRGEGKKHARGVNVWGRGHAAGFSKGWWGHARRGVRSGSGWLWWCFGVRFGGVDVSDVGEHQRRKEGVPRTRRVVREEEPRRVHQARDSSQGTAVREAAHPV